MRVWNERETEVVLEAGEHGPVYLDSEGKPAEVRSIKVRWVEGIEEPFVTVVARQLTKAGLWYADGREAHVWTGIMRPAEGFEQCDRRPAR